MSDRDFLSIKIRRLSQALALSCILNIFVLAFVSYWMIREVPPTTYCELKPAVKDMVLVDHRSCGEVVAQYSRLSFSQLVEKLKATRMIENGYAERDLALSCLVSFHHFNLNRALAGDDQPKQHRILLWKNKAAEKSIPLVVYPGLTDTQFDSITAYVKTERWPFTAEGLFRLLQKQRAAKEVNMEVVNTFMMMPEFLSLELLFSRSESAVDKRLIVELILEGNWKLLSVFFNQQKQSQDLSPARRQQLLLQYIATGSKTAAYLLIATDAEFAEKKLVDAHVISVLDKLTVKTEVSRAFAMKMLTSPRGTEVWKRAAARLYDYENETVPPVWNYQAILARFAPSQLPPTIPTPTLPEMPLAKLAATKPASKASQNVDRSYTVQEGDSLWKISRRYHVDLETLKKINQLQSDTIKPGAVLKLPLT